MSETGTRVRRRRKRKKKTPVWKKIVISIGSVLAVLALIFGGLYLWKAEQINGALTALDTETTFTKTASETANTKGILLIGLDNNNGFETLEHRYTDSLTYVGINLDTQEAMMVPIYRDARIPMVCENGREENINRIYDQSDLNCLAESTSAFLNLPIDYYVQTSLDGLTKAIEQFGTIAVTAGESFTQSGYSFVAGETYEMDAPMAIAYLRYRGSSSGLNRANRQLDVLQAGAQQCLGDPFGCFDIVAPILGEIVQTNFPLSQAPKYLGAITGAMTIEQLEVIQGTNTQLADGWTQIVDQADLAAKTEQIRTEIFQ